MTALGLSFRTIGIADAALDPSTLGMRPSGGFLDPERLEQYQQLLGRPIRWYVGFADRDSPAAMRSSVFGQMRADGAVLPQYADQLDLVMTVPLGFGRANARSEEGRAEIAANLQATASGQFDDDYRAVAEALVDGGYGDAVIRLGHESTGSWVPWSAEFEPALYVEAYRHVNQVLKGVSPKFRFEWNVMRDEFPKLGPPAYPGDQFVDFIGVDVYHRPETADQLLTERMWQNRFEGPLQTHLDFAIAHGKPVAYSEWAVGQVEDPLFIAKMADWFRRLPASGPGRLGYQIYWNTGEDRFNLDLYPQNRAALIEQFGAGTPTTTAPPTTAPTTTAAPTTTVAPTTTTRPAGTTTTAAPTGTTRPPSTTTTAAPTTTAPSAALPGLSVRPMELREGDRLSVIPVRITLDEPATKRILVDIETQALTAEASSDFYDRAATIEIPAGSTGGWFGVRVIGDQRKERAEEFKVTVTRAKGADIERSSARIVLKNDD